MANSQDITKRLENDFKYHAPTPEQAEKYRAIRQTAHSFALLIVELSPTSREQSLALTSLEEATMWANAAIARNE